MPAKTAPNNGILYGWATGEDYWGGPMNDNLQLIDTMLHPVIRSMSWSAPPPDAVNAAAKSMQSDAPACSTCGHLTIRSGTCYKCLNCGTSMGCS